MIAPTQQHAKKKMYIRIKQEYETFCFDYLFLPHKNKQRLFAQNFNDDKNDNDDDDDGDYDNDGDEHLFALEYAHK